MHITSAELLNGQSLTFGSFNIIVGPNSVGKSTFLRELYRHGMRDGMRESQAPFIYVRDISYANQIARKTAQILLNNVYEEPAQGVAGGVQYTSRISRSLPNRPGPERAKIVFTHNGFQALKTIAGGHQPAGMQADEFQLRKLLFQFHTSADRINPDLFQGALSHAGHPAPDAVNSLHDDPGKLSTLQERFRADYEMELVLLDHQGTTLELGTAPKPLPVEIDHIENRKDRHDAVENWKKNNGYNPLTSAGDGMKAKARLMMSIFEPLDHVLFIDEPELHLYHKQRRALGRHLVELARTENKQVFVVTHDATFVQGVLEGLPAGMDVQLIRMRFEPDNRARKFLKKPLDQAAVAPSRRQEEILAALFFEGVVIVEGAQDRAFYQEARDVLRVGPKYEIGFVSAWGLDRLATVARFCKEMEIPYQCISDFDILLETDPDKIRKKKRSNAKVPPLAELLELRDTKVDLEPIKELLAECHRVTSLNGEKGSLRKYGLGAVGLTDKHKEQLKKFIREYGERGLQIVPNGEVESWVPEADPGRFVEESTDILEESPDKHPEIKDFLQEVIRPFGPREDLIKGSQPNPISSK